MPQCRFHDWDFTPKAWHRATAILSWINALGDLRCADRADHDTDDSPDHCRWLCWNYTDYTWLYYEFGFWDRSKHVKHIQKQWEMKIHPVLQKPRAVQSTRWFSKDALQQLAQGVVGGSFLWDVESHDVAERGAPSAVHQPLRGQILSHFGSRGQVGTRLLRHTALDLSRSISFHIIFYHSISISINPILIFRGCNVWHRHHKLIQILGVRCLCGSAGGSALRTHAGDETWWNISCLAIFHNW